MKFQRPNGLTYGASAFELLNCFEAPKHSAEMKNEGKSTNAFAHKAENAATQIKSESVTGKNISWTKIFLFGAGIGLVGFGIYCIYKYFKPIQENPEQEE